MVEMRKKTVLIVLGILAFGVIGTGLSAFYTMSQLEGNIWAGILKVSYGFPLGWYGYAQRVHPYFPPVYWVSLEALLLDTVFWLAISTGGCFVIVKLMNILHKTRASKSLPVIDI
jgi:hypothetical protein